MSPRIRQILKTIRNTQRNITSPLLNPVENLTDMDERITTDFYFYLINLCYTIFMTNCQLAKDVFVTMTLFILIYISVLEVYMPSGVRGGIFGVGIFCVGVHSSVCMGIRAGFFWVQVLSGLKYLDPIGTYKFLVQVRVSSSRVRIGSDLKLKYL